MSLAKKKFQDMTPGELLSIIGTPLYIGLSETDGGKTVYQAIGVPVNAQSSESERRGLISLTDGEKPTEVTWDMDTYDAVLVWETYEATD